MPENTSALPVARTPIIALNAQIPAPCDDMIERLSESTTDAESRPRSAPASGNRTLATAGCGQWRSCFAKD